MSDEMVQVWQQRDGSWRWRYVVLDHTELRSNRGYESAEEAIRSARQAYPHVAILGSVDRTVRPDGRHAPRASVVRTALVSAAATFVLLAALYALRGRRRGMRRGR